MGAGPAGLFVYVVPFLISTVAGSILAFVLITVLSKGGVLNQLKQRKMRETSGRPGTPLSAAIEKPQRLAAAITCLRKNSVKASASDLGSVVSYAAR